MKTVLIIGQNGQVSTYLQRALKGEYKVVVAGRAELDLSLPSQVQASLQRLNPSVIINPAAYTAVDLAEEESELAYLINRDSVAQLAAYCKNTNTPLVHFSTDYVFDGQSKIAYSEIDSPAPNGVYGASKLAGENAIIASGARAIILRTSWVYSNHGKNFYKTMLALAESRDELSVVADQIGAPTYAGSIAQACQQLLNIILQQGEILPEQTGVYHFSCAGETSWADFAKAIFAQHKIDKMVVHAISTDQYPTPAKRPAYSVLDGGKLHATFGITLPTWQQALSDCVADAKTDTAQNG